jgi:hypothetical protein
MHDFTASVIHEDRMRELRGEADRFRLVRGAQPTGKQGVLSRFVGLVRGQLGRLAMPRRTASAAASTRPETPSLPRIFDT